MLYGAIDGAGTPGKIENRIVDADGGRAGSVTEFTINGRAGVPADASAVFLNVVAVFGSKSTRLTAITGNRTIAASFRPPG